ncbi:MAG: PEGA domain-containing protein [Planctomycetia bacterium]|nr:PEGA domain-containing protein [Planctomycetia bacterium]
MMNSYRYFYCLQIRIPVCVLVCFVVVFTTGCLRRRMTINSNPPGATVYVDGHQLGRTPVSTDFTYYGTRDIRLEMDNYQTLNVKQQVRPPWYQLPPFDFFAETFSPHEIKDQHTWTYNMAPRVLSSNEQIMNRANEFATEGSRVVYPDGRVGPPVLAENMPQNQPFPIQDSQGYPDRGEVTEPLKAPEEIALPPVPGAESVPESSAMDAGVSVPEVPGAASVWGTGEAVESTDPLPSGSESWDGPPRKPAY